MVVRVTIPRVGTTVGPERTIPNTQLRHRYHALKKRGVSTAERSRRCSALIADPSVLANEYAEALRDWRRYDLRGEPFYTTSTRKAPRSKGTGLVTELLKKEDVTLRSNDGYAFRYIHREVSPQRTPRGAFADGKPASASGLGGVDYVALTTRGHSVPILGEIKFRADADPFYAFVQLLTYLSELASEAQTARASRFLFDDLIRYPTRWDLHILLADFNDRGERGPLIPLTCQLATGFRAALAAHAEASTLGRILCLRMETGSFRGSVELAWEA